MKKMVEYKMAVTFVKYLRPGILQAAVAGFAAYFLLIIVESLIAAWQYSQLQLFAPGLYPEWSGFLPPIFNAITFILAFVIGLLLGQAGKNALEPVKVGAVFALGYIVSIFICSILPLGLAFGAPMGPWQWSVFDFLLLLGLTLAGFFSWEILFEVKTKTNRAKESGG